jgi:hypothetical protein
MMNSIARLPISSFHFVHAYKARIAEKKVWFTKCMTTSELRMSTVIEMIANHLTWKVQTHIRYKKKCRNYFFERCAWERILLEDVIDFTNIIWSIQTLKHSILRIIETIPLQQKSDYRNIVEAKNAQNIFVNYVASRSSINEDVASVFRRKDNLLWNTHEGTFPHKVRRHLPHLILWVAYSFVALRINSSSYTHHSESLPVGPGDSPNKIQHCQWISFAVTTPLQPLRKACIILSRL